MNDFGKSSVHILTVDFFLMLLAVLSMPYIESSGSSFGYVTDITPDLSEHIYWFFLCLCSLAMCLALCFLISALFCYSVYFVQRAWYLHKLRKPERVYTGDLL